jgi:hypothetical protein
MVYAERRTNHALRRRIDQLLHRVQDARAEIVRRGLDAVHGANDAADRAARGDRARDRRDRG